MEPVRSRLGSPFAYAGPTAFMGVDVDYSYEASEVEVCSPQVTRRRYIVVLWNMSLIFCRGLSKKNETESNFSMAPRFGKLKVELRLEGEDESERGGGRNTRHGPYILPLTLSTPITYLSS